jgi:TPR repeat protein
VCAAVGHARFARQKAAALAGNPSAMCNLSLSYKRGVGVAVDASAAMTWLRRAAAAGPCALRAAIRF